MGELRFFCCGELQYGMAEKYRIQYNDKQKFKCSGTGNRFAQCYS